MEDNKGTSFSCKKYVYGIVNIEQSKQGGGGSEGKTGEGN